jgi:hypothetical protein
MSLAEAVKKVEPDDMIALIIDAEREIERKIIALLEKLYRPHIDMADDMAIADKITRLENALNLAIRCRLQLEAAKHVGTNTYKIMTEIIAPSLAEVDRALAEL